MLSVKQGDIFGMTWLEIELRSPGPLANTLPTKPMDRSNVEKLKKYLVWTNSRIKNEIVQQDHL